MKPSVTAVTDVIHKMLLKQSPFFTNIVDLEQTKQRVASGLRVKKGPLQASVFAFILCVLQAWADRKAAVWER